MMRVLERVEDFSEILEFAKNEKKKLSRSGIIE